MGNSLKALAVAFLIMSLPIFVVTYVVFDSYRERDEKITIVPVRPTSSRKHSVRQVV